MALEFRSAFLRKQDDLIFIFPCKHVVMNPQNNDAFAPCLVDSLCGGVVSNKAVVYEEIWEVQEGKRQELEKALGEKKNQ